MPYFSAFCCGVQAGLWLELSRSHHWGGALIALAWAFLMAWASDRDLLPVEPTSS